MSMFNLCLIQNVQHFFIARASYAKKQADLELELGGFSCDICRGNKLAYNHLTNSSFRPFVVAIQFAC